MNNFEEIFDASTVRESLGLPAQPVARDVILKMDQPLWVYEQPSNMPSEMVRRIESDDFNELIAGPTVTPEYAFGPGSAELAAFQKLKPAPVVSSSDGREMSNLFAKLSKRAKSIGSWDAPKHRAKLKGIIDKFRNSAV